MSDGPHRSLPLRPGWKTVAEAADNEAASVEEIAEKIPAALKRDWNQEVPGRLVHEIARILTDEQGTLFPDDRKRDLEALRPQVAGAVLGNTLLDHAIELAGSERIGREVSAAEPIEATLMERALSCSRAVEEHYHRKASRERSDNVRRRIQDGIRESPISDLARELAGDKDAPAVAGPRKRSGIDEGVEL